MKLEWTSFTLPAYWASYLINADRSGYSDCEIQQIDDFIEELKSEGWTCEDVSEESWFAHRNDANNTGDTVAEFTFMREAK